MSITNKQEFFADLDKFADKLEIETSELVVRTGLEVFRRVVSKTPVLTGRARASWTFAEGSPDPSVAAEGEHLSDPILPTIPTVGKYPIIYVSNNLDYILELENGHSQQAPLGMAGITVAEVEQWLNAQMRML